MFALLATALSANSGCMGPRALQATRQNYNEVIHKTGNEQLLLNLVRLRYRDPPSFLELGSLSTQFSFDHSASLDGAFFHAGRAPAVMGFDASADIAERPTVTYSPLQGPEFVEKLISPMSLETIILIGRSGWSLDRVLRCTVQELNGLENARSASGPIPQYAPREFAEFQAAVRTLRELQLEGQIEFGFESHSNALSEVWPSELITAEVMVNAAREGWLFRNVKTQAEIPASMIEPETNIPWDKVDPEFIENLASEMNDHGLTEPLVVRWDSEREKFVVIEGHRNWMAIQAAIEAQRNPEDSEAAPEPLPAPGAFLAPDVAWMSEPPDQEQSQINPVQPQLNPQAIPCEVISDSGFYLAGTKESLIVRYDAIDEPLLRSLPGPRTERGDKRELPLSIEPRSLLGTMYYLSHAIEVPPEHAACGLAMFTEYEWGEPFDWNQVTGDLLRVSSSRRRPDCAFVAVKYRDYWFYIDDRDHESKATFTLLMQLFELQAGGGATGTRPVLTLSVGG